MRLKKLFFKEDTEIPQARPETRPVPKTPPVPVASSIYQKDLSVPVSQTTDTAVAEDPEEYRAVIVYFDELMKNSNLKGPDIYEFMKALEMMQLPGVDEAVIYNSVYASHRATDHELSMERYEKSAAHYISIIEEKEKANEATYSTKKQEILQKINSETEFLKKSNQEMEAQILEIQAKIKANSDRLEVLSNESTVATQRLDVIRRAFICAKTDRITKIESVLSKIKTHIKQ